MNVASNAEVECPHDDSATERLCSPPARIAARIEATLPLLATNADMVDLKRTLGYLDRIMLGGIGFLILLITSMS